MNYEPHYTNLVNLLKSSIDRNGGKPLFGTHVRDAEWRWISYREFGDLVDAFRAGLASLGVGSGDRVAVVSNNRLEWAVGAQATYGLGAAYVAMYESQLEEEWKYILSDSGAKVCLAATNKLATAIASFRTDVPTLEHVVCFEGQGETTFERLVAKGQAHPVDVRIPDQSDIAAFIYTSGTTGRPKGVRLTHFNLAANISSLVDLDIIGEDERSLAFLPWAHVFGGSIELHGVIATGSSLAICDDVGKILEYLPVVRPTMLFAVPRIWNRIYDGVNKQMASKPAAIQQLFRLGMSARSKQKRKESLTLRERVALPLAEKLIFSKVRDRFGGRLRFAISGAAALSREVSEFVDNLGIQVYEGYGMTESSGVSTTNRPGTCRLGSVGKPVPGVSVKLDKSAPGVEPDEGEVIIYGTGVMAGYHNLPEATREALTEDGGLHSGDVGRIDADGFLFITGRVKELYKLANGKYVAPAPLEEKLQLSPYIAQCVIYGEDRTHNVAMIVPDMQTLEQWARDNGVDGDLLSHPKVRELIERQLAEYGKGFKGYERVRDFFLESAPLTAENGMLTPTLKLKRRNLMKKYGSRFTALYS